MFFGICLWSNSLRHSQQTHGGYRRVQSEAAGGDEVNCIRGRDAAADVFVDLIKEHGITEQIGLDNGPEIVAKRLRDWLRRVGTISQYITSGRPWENGYCWSFNGKLWGGLLNSEVFHTLREETFVIDR